MNHTPGPWRFRKYAGDDELIASMRERGLEPCRMLTNDGQVAIMSGDENNPSRIALVDAQVSFKRGKGSEAECVERDANVALMAASPEMYEALKVARAQVLAVCEHNESVNGGAKSVADRKDLEQIDAAIAKAEGKQ